MMWTVIKTWTYKRIINVIHVTKNLSMKMIERQLSTIQSIANEFHQKYTWAAHWQRVEAKPESTDATRIGIIPNHNVVSSSTSLLLFLGALLPRLNNTAATNSSSNAPICCLVCLCLQGKSLPLKYHPHISQMFQHICMSSRMANLWVTNVECD